jgi:hypothetical protein
MKIRVYILLLLYLMFTAIVCAGDEATQNREHLIKAAFIYNFAQFTDWPKDKFSEPNTITIGLLGDHPFGSAFDPVKNKTVKEKRLNIKNFGKFRTSFTSDNAGNLELANYIEQLRKCHVLFICDSERENFKKILDAVKGYGVLTVGETDDFLDANGTITFVQGTDKPIFEINLKVAEREGLKISSKVLRLARKVIGGETADISTGTHFAVKPENVKGKTEVRVL